MKRTYLGFLAALVAGTVALALTGCNPNQPPSSTGTTDTGQMSAGNGTTRPGAKASPMSGMNQQAGQAPGQTPGQTPGLTGANTSGSSQ